MQIRFVGDMKLRRTVERDEALTVVREPYSSIEGQERIWIEFRGFIGQWSCVFSIVNSGQWPYDFQISRVPPGEGVVAYFGALAPHLLEPVVIRLETDEVDLGHIEDVPQFRLHPDGRWERVVWTPTYQEVDVEEVMVKFE